MRHVAGVLHPSPRRIFSSTTRCNINFYAPRRRESALQSRSDWSYAGPCERTSETTSFTRFVNKGKKKGRDFVTADPRKEEASTKESYLTSSTLRRWGGGGAVLGGTLFATWGYLHGNITLSSSGPIVTAAMGLLIDTLFLVGLGGVCAWWWQGRMGWVGAVGFLLGFAGAAMSVGQGIHAFVVASGIAEPAPWYVYVRAGTGVPAKVFRWLPLLPIGLTTVGVYSIVTGALRGWGPLLLAMGLVGWAYHLTDSGEVFRMSFAHMLLGVVFSVGWVVLGCLLWSKGSARDTDTSRE
jgi:hypothetical protein